MTDRSPEADPFETPDVHTAIVGPLFSHIQQVLGGKRPAIVGVTGPPGVGKSTTCRLLYELAKDANEFEVRIVALEDYYYSPLERERRGQKWRAVPGTHRLDELRDTLSRVMSGSVVDSLPRFDMGRDQVVESEPVGEVISLLLLDGWLLDCDHEDYAFVAESLDYLVYLDAPESAYKHWRFEREKGHRGTGDGYSAQKMSKFWGEALEPTLNRWVIPQRDRANAIVEFDYNHEFKRLHMCSNLIRKTRK